LRIGEEGAEFGSGGGGVVVGFGVEVEVDVGSDVGGGGPGVEAGEGDGGGRGEGAEVEVGLEEGLEEGLVRLGERGQLGLSEERAAGSEHRPLGSGGGGRYGVLGGGVDHDA
jgi:hypothetical protein